MTKAALYRDHVLRDVEMRRHDATKAVYMPYDRLKKAAHEARYEATPFRPTDVPDFADYHRRIRDAMVTAIK